YPNPWPKAGQLSRRIHGDASFFDLLRCSARLELRTNWEVYAREFAFALSQARAREVEARPLKPPSVLADAAGRFQPGDAGHPSHSATEYAVSPFEAKYAASGHPLWIVREP